MTRHHPHARHRRRPPPRHRRRRAVRWSCSPTASPSCATRGATRSQPLADAGYRVIAPDQRGYGRSSAPDRGRGLRHPRAHRRPRSRSSTTSARSRPSFVGHDFGRDRGVAARAARARSASRGVVGMSVPFMPRAADAADRDAPRQVLGDSFFYMLYFQEPGRRRRRPRRAIPPRTMRRLLAGATMSRRRRAELDPSFLANDGRGFVDRIPEPDGLPDWLSQAELDHYVAEFTRTGFTGAINWYRNLDRNWELPPSPRRRARPGAVAVHRRRASTRCC